VAIEDGKRGSSYVLFEKKRFPEGGFQEGMTREPSNVQKPSVTPNELETLVCKKRGLNTVPTIINKNFLDFWRKLGVSKAC